ncbi:MAG: PAS domain S-box protein [Desulfobacteraceae bacterium]
MAGDLSCEVLKRQTKALQDEMKQLKQDREIYAEIFMLSPNLICVADINTSKFLKVNPAFTALLGYEEEELLRHSFIDFIHPEDIEPTIAIVNEKLKLGKKVSNFTNRYRCSDGTYRWLEWISRPMPERGITFASAHDITQRKAIEASLRESEERLDLALSGANEGAWEGKIVARNEKRAPTRFTGTHSDIADHKLMQRGLQESEERYRALHDASFGGLFLHYQGIVLECNQGLSDMTGYTLDELMGMDALNTLVAHDWRETVAKNIASGFDQPYEAEGIRKDGTVFPLYIHGKNVPYKGRIVRSVEYRDLTEKKLAERTLQQNYIQLKAIYNTLPVIIWSLDEKGIFTLSEGKELLTLGLEPGQVVGMSVFDQYKDHPKLLDGIKKGLSGNLCEFESDLNGATYHIVLTPSFDKEKTVSGLNGIAVNITEKRKTEEEIRKLRNYLSNIINSMPSLIVGVDRKCSVTQWNKTAEKATGISAEDARSKIISDVLPQMAFEKGKIIQSIQTRQINQENNKPFKAQTEMRYVDVTIFPLIANGVEGAVIRIDDVTDNVRLEEIMVQSEKMVSVGGLAAGMAHEINNPLAGMIQTANIMKSRLADLQIPANLRVAEEIGIPMEHIKTFMQKRDILRMLEAINESGRRVADIVDNMLSFARKTEATFSYHHPAQLMDKTLELAVTDYDLKKQYDFKTIQIIKKYENNLPMLHCEGAKIQQVLLNILRNGAQAMQAEHTEKDAAPSFILRLSVETDTNMLKIEIEDNGPGMDKPTQSRIFEPFFTTKPVGVGTGLGLSVSYFIITQNHGGTMDVASILGKGSTFIIRLPLEQNS